jgi:large subunit ribosomal protein L4
MQDSDALANLLLAVNPSAPTAQLRASPAQMALKEKVMVPVPVLGFDGEKKGEKEMALKIAESGPYIVQRRVVWERAKARGFSGVSVKTRGEVRGGGRKPYRQKGTGQARRGSTRSPLIRGGGKCFGPRPKDWSIDMNKKERKLALSTALMNAAKYTVVVPDLESNFEVPKTKNMVGFLKNVGIDVDKENVLILLEKGHNNLMKSGKNLPRLTIQKLLFLNVCDILKANKIVLSEAAYNELAERYDFNAPSSMPSRLRLKMKTEDEE